MKTFKDFSRSQKILTITAGLLAGAFFLFDEQDNTSMESSGYPGEVINQADNRLTGTAQSHPVDGGSITADGKVVLYDKGLQMPMGTYTLPEGWKLIQDIAIDPSTNMPVRYQVDIFGTQGELIKALGTSRYGQMAGGMSYEQSLQRTVASGLSGELEQIRLGNPEPDPQAEQRAAKNEIYRRVMNQGMQVQCLKIPISGLRHGQKYEGYIQVTRIMPANNPHSYGSVTVTCAIGQAGQSMALMQVKNNIDDSFTIDPAYQQRRDQLQAQVLNRQSQFHQEQMANSRATHQQRMLDNQNRFNAHQQNMADMNQIQDARQESWLNGFRNSGSSSNNGNSGYDGQDAYIDGIHERSTFYDPDSGYERSLDGQYDYNYTDGLGNYYRTNDANFDPNSLQGDWQEVEPLSPEY